MRERYTIRTARTLLLAMVAGCAQGPYQYGDFSTRENGPATIPEKVVVERGGSHERLDRMSDALSWPRRKLFPELPDRREITPATLEQVTEYLDKNDLREVYVSVRDYQPRQQWRRLRESRVVSPLSRYTLGSLSVVGYTLFPGKLFDRNSYNPYTDTLNVNADTPALLVHHAASAKSIRQRKLPGAYAVASELPLFRTWSDINAAQDVVGYAQAEENWALEEETYRRTYPKVGSEAVFGAGLLVPVWWGIPLVRIAGGAAGNATGRAMLARREAERQDAQTELVERDVQGRDVQQVSYAEPEETSRRRYLTPSSHQQPTGRATGEP